MLSIFATTKYVDQVRGIIATEARLSELITIYDSRENKPLSSGKCLIVDQRGIVQPLDWQNYGPPYLLASPLKLEKSTLLALLFSKLGNPEKAWHYADAFPLLQAELNMATLLQNGYQLEMETFLAILDSTRKEDSFAQYRMLHNSAIIRHYGFVNETIDFSSLEQLYQKAYDASPNGEYRAFTAKDFATLLLDAGELHKATTILTESIEGAISDEAIFNLKSILTKVWMKKLTIPYDLGLLEQLKETLWETLQFFEKNNQNAECGLLLLDAAHIANISESFSESLGYVNKAIDLFEEENLVELVGNAQLRKGTLLYTWAQNGNPQFFKSAIESYQDALKIFTKELAPNVFAEIHHHLGVIYSDMPSETKKKGILAGVAVASFNEALEYYTKDRFPYEYGMICNNYGNAFTKIPPGCAF